MTIATRGPGVRPPRRNVFARHWRGELPLWVSFWVVGAGAYLAGMLATLASLGVLATIDVGQALAAGLLVYLLSVVLHYGALVFALVGIWRAASQDNRIRAEAGRVCFPGYAAKAVVVVVAYLYYVGPVQNIVG